MEGRKTKVLVVFYSLYGHIYKMAEAVAEGARSAGAEVDIRRVAETLPKEVLEKMHAVEAGKAFESIPIVQATDLPNYDAIIFGSPTRYGGPAAQFKGFIDSLGQLWMTNALVGKVAGVFTSSGTQHGGQETTLMSIITNLFHLGFVVAGLPYSFAGQKTDKEISGGTPYGATTIAGDGSRQPSQNELDGAKFQGKHIAEIASKLKK